MLPLEEAAASDSFAEIVSTHLGHSGQYLRDGINALSTAFLDGAAFVCLHNKARLNLPLYIYHLANSRQGGLFTQPRSLIYLAAGSSMQVVETFATQGEGESLLNHITEIVAEKDSRLEYYKIQNDGENASQVSTTHIRQLGTSYTHSVVVSLNGQLVRNNLNVIFDAPGCESHLFGLYCLHGQTHLDNHTVVDNGQPNCLSNELYKGIIDDEATGIFNGKIFVRKDAQKTNAYQSNKNILLSNHATINAKPQLEIFADDVKCSHGCTVGSLDEDALFYLRTRGVSRSSAKALLLGAFAGDILGNIHLEPLRHHVQQLIAQRLNIENL